MSDYKFKTIAIRPCPEVDERFGLLSDAYFGVFKLGDSTEKPQYAFLQLLDLFIIFEADGGKSIAFAIKKAGVTKEYTNPEFDIASGEKFIQEASEAGISDCQIQLAAGEFEETHYFYEFYPVWTGTEILPSISQCRASIVAGDVHFPHGFKIEPSI